MTKTPSEFTSYNKFDRIIFLNLLIWQNYDVYIYETKNENGNKYNFLDKMLVIWDITLINKIKSQKKKQKKN